MYSSQVLHGTPMSVHEASRILGQSTLIVDDVHWLRTGGGDYSVAEYEGVIHGEKVFLHLMSIEMSNYWIVTWPEQALKRSDGIKLSEYDLSSITKNAEKALLERLAKD